MLLDDIQLHRYTPQRSTSTMGLVYARDMRVFMFVCACVCDHVDRSCVACVGSKLAGQQGASV